MAAINFDEINGVALSAYPGLLYDFLPDGELRGHEFKARNPTRSDSKAGSFSINTDTGRWGDFAVNGASGGDPVSLYAYVYSLEQGEAAKQLAAKLGLSEDPETARQIKKRYDEVKKKKKKKQKKQSLTPIIPVPKSASRKLPDHKKLGKPSIRWMYKDAQKRPLGFVCRFELGDGKKETLPLTYCRAESGGEFWAWKGFTIPNRPLYGLDRLAAKPDAMVLMVEGEKAADAAHRLFPKMAVVSWPGGGKAVHNVDFSPLAGRKVIMWPDADMPGIETAALIKKEVPEDTKYKAITPPSDVEKGWDAADAEAEGWTTEQATEWLQARFKETKSPKSDPAPNPDPTPEPPHHDEAPAHADYSDIPQNHSDDNSEMEYQPTVDPEAFRILGYNRGTYYYLPSSSSQVVELSPSAHTKLNLLQLADLGYWETRYPKKGGADWDMAANALIIMSHRAGVFRDHERRRGRGAWADNGKAVLHLGNKLIADGQQMLPIDFQSEYTYEGDSPLKIQPLAPATNREANELVHICKSIRWDNSLSALALAGWCVIAPICGVLSWRPHIWITGPAGSGKTTVMRDVIGRVVGPTALQVESKTTEAGIRSELGYDARPIIFDEAEAEDERSAHRMQGNLDLARVASSESGGVMYKGSATGKSVAYRVRSCFCFSSINTSVQHYADETRVTLLVLSRIHADTEQERIDVEAHYNELMTNIQNHLTLEFASKLIMRSMANLETLQANIETFTYAASIVLGNRRIGDQIGPMLAGAYLCHSTKQISIEDAKKWIEAHDFTDHAAISGRGDEERLLQYITEHQLRVSSGVGSSYDRTIGEMIGAILEDDGTLVPVDIAMSTLRRHGIRVERPSLTGELNGGIYISTSSEALKRILKGTQWASNWRRPLLSINGAVPKKAVRFRPALNTPAVLLPIDVI